MIEAERLSRRKHHVIQNDEDILAPIRKCCKNLGCRLRDIDTVLFAHTDDFDAKDLIKRNLSVKNFHDIDHHLSHAASAFFSSPYETSAVVSIDGFGDGSSGLICKGEANKLEVLERVSEENSIGLEYLRATVHLGLGGYGCEGKTQGLSAYGDPTLFDAYMNEIKINPNGNITLSEKLRNTGSFLAEQGGYLNTQLLTNSFLNDYCPRRIVPEPITQTHMNLAASVQKMLEYVCMDISLVARKRTSSSNLVLTGGVAMNSSMNGFLLDSGKFDNIFALPMSSDRGTGLGAALYHVHNNLDEPRFFNMDNVFYGGEYDDKRSIRALKKAGLRFTKNTDTIELAAKSLSESKIVAWYQDKSEMGARALGHRSILADPRIAEMKDIINKRVKHREWFRPFAPSVLEERSSEFFVHNNKIADLSYMTFTVQANKHAQQIIPATIHIDGSSRIQTVDHERNSTYSDLIKRFDELTGVPVILNTSFNDNGQPIVETPEDAVKTFLNQDIDVLCMGNTVGWKGNT